HSIQQPNQMAVVTGVKQELISTIAMASIAAGADGVFMETHRNPAEAKSDGANVLPLAEMERVLTKLAVIRCAYNETLNI
ncbi:MAG: 3-deoxy-8-phosphooctulonate synthase, partial [Muribaculaceae bacterium]|nr:3-deoxy-8-phosphooctulonate synthase [Muribaculaceae bacterium]